MCFQSITENEMEEDMPMRVFLDQGEKKEALWKLIPKRFRFQPVRLLGCEADNGVLAGETVLEKTGADVKLLWLWVERSFRKQGAGTMLLDAAVSLAKKLGAESLVTDYQATQQESNVGRTGRAAG